MANPIPAASMPGTVTTKRTSPANAYPVNEPGQPVRTGATAQEQAASLGKIVDWLAPGDSSHLRYWPSGGTTFCNIYAHDYCHLAGVYLPRVWWNDAALAKLAVGTPVAPQYGVTIDEVTANALVPWLKEYGPAFGWQAATDLSAMQDAANQGAVVVVAARHKLPGHHGHIVVVVPEVPGHQARRAANTVVIPLQSQAGATNFNYGFLDPNWWPSSTYAEFGFWIHS